MKAFTAVAVAALSLSQAATAAPFTLVQLDRARAAEAQPTLRLHRARSVSETLGVWRLPSAAVPGLRAAGLVRHAEPDRTLSPVSHAAPADPLFARQWWYARVGADRVEPPGPGRPVTVVDSGLDLSHPEFAGRPDTVALNTQTTSPSRRDNSEFHGTAVSSVVAAPVNGAGLVGVYPQAALRSYDSAPFGEIDLSEIVNGIDVASQAADGVINLSLGMQFQSDILDAIVAVAYGRGSLVVAASGNSREEGSPAEFPASFQHVLTVGATDPADAPAEFSTASQRLDLAAPGEAIPVAVPLSFGAGGYTAVSGTSFSAPIVAGAAAWVWTMRPELDNTQLFEVIRRSSRDVGAPGWDPDTGFGILDIPTALTYPPPVRDPFEPNDDFDFIRSGGELSQPPLTTATRATGRVMARVDAREDLDDLYRVYVPAGRSLTLSLRPVEGDADLELWSNGALTIRVRDAGAVEDRLARSARAGADTIVWRNVTRGPRMVYANVRPRAGTEGATYLLSARTKVIPASKRSQ